MAISTTELTRKLSDPLSFASAELDHQLAAEIEQAIKTKNVCLAYQPVVVSQTPHRVAFYEGLFRARNSAGKLLRAGEFMHIAETHETGRIIDCLSLEMGLAALRETQNIRLSINMSARSIGYRRWIDTLDRGLAADPTVADRLILEITESSAMTMPDIVVAFMSDMHRRGISFALDDFGAGFTAFRYLKDFHFDIVKIDGMFIRNVHQDPNNQVLCQALVNIAQQFEMFTVAEAVETLAEAKFLSAAGVDCLQGYAFGHPSVQPPWISDQQDLRAIG
jgi:EAL domain-containing protein (putative c-di-GMP-specific phosphodiesterase class I)